MQSDMHFYGVYALCRAAGIDPKYAKIIAHSSQFVDDALGDDTLIFPREKKAILPTMTSHRPLDYENVIEENQWRVWVTFHFLPGDNPQAKTFTERMICGKNSKFAQAILQFALQNATDDFSAYLAGVVSHTFADTFAHYGFIGFSTKLNLVETSSIKTEIKSKNIFKYVNHKLGDFLSRIKGSIAETVPIGHGAVATLPDRPYLTWEYCYTKRHHRKVKRTNWKDYLEASRELHKFYGKLLEMNPNLGNFASAVAWNSIADEIEKILKKEGSKENRIAQWKKAINANRLFPANSEDKNIRYQVADWFLSEKKRKQMPTAEIKKQHLYHFYKAAHFYRNYVLGELLPQERILL